MGPLRPAVREAEVGEDVRSVPVGVMRQDIYDVDEILAAGDEAGVPEQLFFRNGIRKAVEFVLELVHERLLGARVHRPAVSK